MKNLKDLMVDTKSAWVDFDGCEGFSVEVAVLARPALISLRKSCITERFDRSTREKVEDFNEEKFVGKFTKATVKNWRGLTLAHLETLLPIDPGEEDLSSELLYSEENAKFLVTNSSEFDSWLNEVVFDLDNFRSRPKDENA